jgi:hypothetical protein
MFGLCCVFVLVDADAGDEIESNIEDLRAPYMHFGHLRLHGVFLRG